MATQQHIDVYFHNMWGSDIYDVTLKFTTSRSSAEGETYTTACVKAGGKWGPLQRTYETGPFSEAFDYWYVEFASPGEPPGQFSGNSKFACVIDSDVPPAGNIDLWISGTDRAFYTGYPDSVGGRPGVSGYSGSPKDHPGGDYTCYSKLEHVEKPVPARDCADG